MKHLTIYGASDDLIEIEDRSAAEQEFGSDGWKKIGENVKGADEYDGEDATFVIAGLEIRVFGGGDWWIAVKPVDEDFPVKAENITLTQHPSGYSMQLDLDVPDDVAHIVRTHAPTG